MINGIWIIKKDAGICIFHKVFEGKEIDPQLFSGFLSGIYTFSEEISESGGIETLELKEVRILYGVVSDLIFILSITKDEDVDIIRKKISDISKVFHEKYSDLLQNWDGNIGIFEPFNRNLNQIMEKMRHVDFVEIPIRFPQKKSVKLTDEEFQVLSLCDGKTPSINIAIKLKIPELKSIQILKNLEKKKIIKRKMIMKM
ncbi:MAG TPA: hypothetical protein VMV49_16745 [Candidatus Deferrimicrobium sp.]|nr:hypothetical protein [Candidatus Deferrimicrobium sp.]